MTQRTKIEWTDATWNPVRGCSRVSPGCDHCYAEGQRRYREANKEKLAEGQRRYYQAHKEELRAYMRNYQRRRRAEGKATTKGKGNAA